MSDTIWKAILLVVTGVGISVMIWLASSIECKKSHTETQWQMPPSVVVGGGEYGGGVAIPMGNAKEVEVTVCDEWGPIEEEKPLFIKNGK